jgi:hypothetical protein
VEARLRELGWNRSRLAEAIGVSSSAITILMRPVTKQSRLVPRIHRALGWREPATAPAAPESPDRQRLVELFDDLDEESRNLLLRVAERLARKEDD